MHCGVYALWGMHCGIHCSIIIVVYIVEYTLWSTCIVGYILWGINYSIYCSMHCGVAADSGPASCQVTYSDDIIVYLCGYEWQLYEAFLGRSFSWFTLQLHVVVW